MSSAAKTAAIAWLIAAVYYFYQYALRSAPAVMMPELSDAFGISALAGTRRGRVGGYGEIGVALFHEYGWSREFVDSKTMEEPNFSTCTETDAFSGPALRVGGTFVFPVHPNFQLTTSAMVTLGSFSLQKSSSGCVIPPNTSARGETETDIRNRDIHQQIFFGAGADFTFGPG